MEGHTNITLMGSDGESKVPKGTKMTLVNKYGYFVRQNIPISYKLWKKTKATDSDADIMPDSEKEMLRRVVKRQFNFPDEKEKNWILRKIVIAFHTFKKNLNKDYAKKDLMPDFERNFKKQRPFWDASCSTR